MRASLRASARRPAARGSVSRLAEQVDALLRQLRPRVLIFDEFHNALRGRSRDVEAIFAFLRRLGREYDVSPVLIGEVAVYDHVIATQEMASRLQAAARAALALWRALSGVARYARGGACRSRILPNLSDEALARRVFSLSEGLIGETVRILVEAAILAIHDGAERITPRTLDRARLYAAVASAAGRRCAKNCCRPPLRKHAGPAIEVQPRLATLVPERWPAEVVPAQDELLSSWLHRLAFAHGLSPRHFGDCPRVRRRRMVGAARSQGAGDLPEPVA